MNVINGRRPRVTMTSTNGDREYTDEQILEKFLAVPDEEWPLALIEHPILASVLRAEVERVLQVHRKMRELLEGLIRELDDTERRSHVEGSITRGGDLRPRTRRPDVGGDTVVREVTPADQDASGIGAQGRLADDAAH